MSLAPEVISLDEYPSPNNPDRAEFSREAYEYTVKLAQFSDNINALVDWINTNINGQNPITISTASANILADYSGGYIRTTYSGAKSLTIQPESSIPQLTGASFFIANKNAGDLTIIAGSGVTINNNVTLAQNAAAIIQRVSADAYDFIPIGGEFLTDLSDLEAAIAALETEKAPLSSPEFTDEPTAPTPPSGDNSNKLANTAFVRRDAITTVETIAALQALGEVTDGQTIAVLSGSNTGDFIYNPAGSGSAAFNNIVPATLPGRFEKIDSSSAQVIIDATPKRLDDAISDRALTTLTNATTDAEANLFDLSEIVLSVPSGFPWTPSFGIYRNRGGVFCVDLDPKSLQPKRPTTKLWVDVVIGNDANSGISPSLPFKTLLAALNSATYTGTSGPCVIYINDGFYAYDQSMAAGLIIRPTSLIGIGGKPRLTGALSGASPTWTQQTAPNTNVYSANVSAASMVWDSSVTSDNGYFYRYTSVASVADCQALAGSFYFTGSVLYVHALSGISPGAEIYINRNGNGHVSHTTTSALYCENISFELAGTFNFNVTGGAAAAPAVFNRCDFLYMMSNGFYTNRNGNIYLFDCHAGNNGRDGYNYEGNDVARTQNVLEVNCRGIKNGWDTTGTNNGSTAHYYTNIISVNCYMDRNADRQIHDVDAVCRWIVGSYAGRATNGSVVPYESFNYGSGRETGDTTQMWIDSISSQGGAVDLFVGDGCTIYTRRISSKTNSGDGTITSF